MTQPKVIFNDGERTFANAKALRAWVRKNGLTVRDGRKEGHTYWLDCNMPGGPVSMPAPPVPQGPRPERTPVPQGPRPERMPVPQGPRPERMPEGLTVLGKDLQPGHTIISPFPVPLTIDDRGVGSIQLPRPKGLPSVIRDRDPIWGFHSVQSGSISSYPIDPEKQYVIECPGNY